jgi:hypothetical protein
VDRNQLYEHRGTPRNGQIIVVHDLGTPRTQLPMSDNAATAANLHLAF